MDFVIRPMAEGDIPAKGRVHSLCWRETYRGLIPGGYLESITPEFCTDLARSRNIDTLVALCVGEMAGFVCFCAEARPFTAREGCSEVAALYVLRKYQSLGLGRALMESALGRLPHGRVILYVLDGNRRAIEFYRHMGFELTGRELREEVPGGELRELEMMKKRGG